MLKNIKPLGLIIKNGIKYGFYSGFLLWYDFSK